MRHKAGIWILFLLLPCPCLQPWPGTTVGLSCSNNLLPLRRTPNEYWPNWLAAAAPEAGTETEAAQLFDFGLSVSPIFVFVFRICVCARAPCLCLCLCLTLSLPKTQSIIFNLTLDREMELQIYNRYSCIYRYVFDADTCRDIGIFTVAVARVKDMNAATDTFICRYSCTFRCIHTSI